MILKDAGDKESISGGEASGASGVEIDIKSPIDFSDLNITKG
jgi:hypothetical protein